MRPASYRAAPPRVGETTIPQFSSGFSEGVAGPSRRPGHRGQPVGLADADCPAAASYAWIAACRSDCAFPMPAKSPLRCAVASASRAALIWLTAWSRAGLPEPPAAGGGDAVGEGAGLDSDGGALLDGGADDPLLSAAASPAPAPNTWSSASARVLA